MHISSIVVHADPGATSRVRGAIDALPGLETHAATDAGKLVVTIEAASEEATVALFERVRVLPGVLAVAMVFHQFESTPDQEV